MPITPQRPNVILDPMPSPTPTPGPDKPTPTPPPTTFLAEAPGGESPEDRLGVWRKYLQDTGGGTQETFADWLKGQQPAEEPTPAPTETPAPDDLTVEQAQRLVKTYIESRVADAERRAEDPQLPDNLRTRHRGLADMYRQRLAWAEMGVRGPEDLPQRGEDMAYWLQASTDRIDDAMGTGERLGGGAEPDQTFAEWLGRSGTQEISPEDALSRPVENEWIDSTLTPDEIQRLSSEPPFPDLEEAQYAGHTAHDDPLNPEKQWFDAMYYVLGKFGERAGEDAYRELGSPWLEQQPEIGETPTEFLRRVIEESGNDLPNFFMP